MADKPYTWVARCDKCKWVLIDYKPPVIRGANTYAKDCPRACAGNCIQIDDPPQDVLMAAYAIGGADAMFELLPWEDIYERRDLPNSWQEAKRRIEEETPGAMYKVAGAVAIIPCREIRKRLRRKGS